MSQTVELHPLVCEYCGCFIQGNEADTSGFSAMPNSEAAETDTDSEEST